MTQRENNCTFCLLRVALFHDENPRTHILCQNLLRRGASLARFCTLVWRVAYIGTRAFGLSVAPVYACGVKLFYHSRTLRATWKRWFENIRILLLLLECFLRNLSQSVWVGDTVLSCVTDRPAAHNRGKHSSRQKERTIITRRNARHRRSLMPG